MRGREREKEIFKAYIHSYKNKMWGLIRSNKKACLSNNLEYFPRNG